MQIAGLRYTDRFDDERIRQRRQTPEEESPEDLGIS
jgi:hypothetical protein